MRLELVLLPFAAAALTFCARKTLGKFSAGEGPIVWGLGVVALGLFVTVIMLLQD